MAVSISPTITFSAIETLDTGVDGAPAPDILHSGFNLSGVTLNSSSSAPVTMTSYQQYALSGGAFTIDLMALLGVNDEVQDADGLKLQTIVILNTIGNNPITVTTGASNGFPLLGGTNSIVIPAGAWFAFYVPEGLAEVGASDKTIDIAGTLVETFKVGICLG